MKNGKLPLSQKPKPASTAHLSSDFLGNQLAIDDELKAELKGKNLEYRFIDANEAYANGGYHKRGWSVYKRDTPPTGTISFKFGNDPEGIVRRGTMILAVKRAEDAQRHRDYLAYLADNASIKKKQKADAELLRKHARDNQVDMNVEEGYGEEDK